MNHSSFSTLRSNVQLLFIVMMAPFGLMIVPALGQESPGQSTVEQELGVQEVIEQDSLLLQLEQALGQEDLVQAMAIGKKLENEADQNLDITLPLARLARALQREGQLERSADFFKRSIAASEREAAVDLELQKKLLVRMAAGSVLTEVNQLSEAIKALRPTLMPDSSATDSQRETTVTMLLRIGATALAIGAHEIASQAYSLASEHATENQHATAMLGDAWAMAVERKHPLDAARKLASFIEKYPKHADAPRAARACAECLKQAGRAEDSSVMLSDLLLRWPDSESALDVVASHSEFPIGLVPQAVQNWLLESALNDRISKLDARMTVQGLMAASNREELKSWSNLANHLASIDDSGQPTSDVLSDLTKKSNLADAERLATILIAPTEIGGVQAAAREAACRWAGRTQHWSMLALASESEDLNTEDPSRTIAVERLFAESLMQMGRVQEASKWWNHLVDYRQVDDFATLLRCAESETSSGTEVAMAKKRIDAARGAAANDRFQQSLVDLLDAELAIRRSEFDRARGLLEKVVRLNEAEANLRGRAQWLIGETHYLQEDFVDAINAYRRVEGIDPGGTWVSAALIQAGKSFERLGMTREATVCYTNLLSRFAETSYAELARRRLAAISPDSGSSVPSSAQPLRR